MIQFFIDKEPRYLNPVTRQVYTQEEVDQMKEQQIQKDRKHGFADRMSGFYDKWYRYNRKDNGKAYDEGVQEAINTPGCSESLQVIECIK